MSLSDQQLLLGLLSPEAVRARCHEIYVIAEARELIHFELCLSNLNRATELVLSEMRQNYPHGKVPFHSRWRHFEFGSHNLWTELFDSMTDASPEERVRRRIDLAVVSVLIDAGAGTSWRYTDYPTGLSYGRSEGLALASLRLFQSGLLSKHGDDDPCRVDAERLENIQPQELAEFLQVNDTNQLLGVGSRASLLNRLGTAIREANKIFILDGDVRPGNLFDYVVNVSGGGEVKAQAILEALLIGLGGMWPDGEWISNVPLGDVGRHKGIARNDITDGIVPFHKLSQWMTFSLIEPFQEAGINVIDLDALTGLAEYRNGGLFVDTGILQLKDLDTANQAHDPKSTLIVEWRAMTVALLDQIVIEVRNHTGDDAVSLPLASVLQGGTWTAGRRIAQQIRENGVPPINILSKGTIF